MIKVSHLYKTYSVPDAHRNWLLRRSHFIDALKDISFDIEDGEVVALLGLNGSGKSTLIKILCGILAPTSGKVSVLGFDPFQQRTNYVPNIGVVFGSKTILWWDVPLIESFRLYATMYCISENVFNERLSYFQTIFDLKAHLDTPPRKLSLGERMRAEIVASILHNPQILFMDEPTIGLDVVAREEVRTFIRSLQLTNHTTIVYTSHILTDVEQLCNRVIILNNGQIVIDGAVDQVRQMAGCHLVRCTYSTVKDPAALDMLLAENVATHRGHTLIFPVSAEKVSELVEKLLFSVSSVNLSVEPPSLEDVLKRLSREDS